MADCLWELQKAAFTVLDGDATLSGLVTGVYDQVPQDTSFPFVVIESIGSSGKSTKTEEVIQAIVSIAVYSRYRGKKEVWEILNEVKRIMHNNLLSMTGCTMVINKYQRSGAQILSDGLTQRGFVEFNCVIEAA